MPMERRGRQNLNLATGTQAIHGDGENEHKGNQTHKDLFPNRWARIGFAAQDKQLVFNNLMTHVNEDSLREAFKAIDGSKALGVDGISKSEYGRNLSVNLEDLAQRVQKGTYRPMPKREILIPKAKGKTRPIAIACFEDKLVDWVVGKILSQVVEPLFIRNSFGYRPNKSADDAIKACYYSLYKNTRKNVVEIDFSSFFNTIPHRKLMRVLGRRISDRRFKGLIGRFLKGELITAGEEQLPSKIGTPQGSIMSPVLANIYLNEVIDQWFIQNYASYNNIIVRYADDAIFLFKKEETAVQFLKDLNLRVTKYGLTLNTDKTHIITIAKNNHKQFNFLGLTFHWGKQGSRYTLKVKTQKDKLIKSIQEFEQWIKKVRNQRKLKDIWQLARSKIKGHINYFGYWMNSLKLRHFYDQAIKALFKWLNRRSQKLSYRWDGFKERLRNFPLIEPIENMKLKQLGWNPYA
jgi:RNA-directed DNA polymerase